MIRIAHTADIHARRDRMDEVLASLNSMIDRLAREPVDVIVVAGDIWDSAPSATGPSRYPELLNAFRCQPADPTHPRAILPQMTQSRLDAPPSPRLPQLL